MKDTKVIMPPVDVYEASDGYMLVLDMPGALKDTIEITTEGDTLTVKADTVPVADGWKPLVTEFETGQYRRVFTIGQRVDREKIRAKYESGVLTIEMEKSEQVRPRKIEVKAA